MSDGMGVPLDERQLLCRRLGDRLREVYCTFWLFQGEMDTSEVGDVTLVFESGTVFRFGHTSFGHDLVLYHDRWNDPLTEPWEAEQQQDVEPHGMLVEVCVNDWDEYRPLIRNRLLAVGEIYYLNEIIGDERLGFSFHFPHDKALFVANTADTVWMKRSVDLTVFGERLICSLPTF
jgi:hypothetical protein